MSIKEIIHSKKGDTIVEVLLSIAVLSLILSISYALSNKDLQYTQQSQERSEAQGISEQQLELLRNYLTPTTDWNASHFVCFDDNDPPQPTTSSSNCHKGTKDSGVGRYLSIISYDATNQTYTVNTTWSSLTSTTPQSLAFSYKLPISSLHITGSAPQCNDGKDNDGDGKVDLADPGCLGDPTRNDEVEPPVNLAVNVKKVPPLAGNVTPGCGAATQNRSGARVTVGGVGAQYTDSTSSTTFTPLSPNTTYGVSVSGPSGYTVCAPTSQTTTTGGFGTTKTLNFKMYPNCYTPIVGYTSGYWAFGPRRPDLDGFYIIDYRSGWNSDFVAPHWTGAAPGEFHYIWANWQIGNAGYYWLYEAYWVSGSPIYGSPTCP